MPLIEIQPFFKTFRGTIEYHIGSHLMQTSERSLLESGAPSPGEDGLAPPLEGADGSEKTAAVPARPASLTRRIAALLFHGIAQAVQFVFGVISLILLLAVVAAIPLVNFLALGYLLEVEGRVARSGRLRDAFPLIDVAPRLGSIVLGMIACIFPVRFLADAAADARLIDLGSRFDVGLHLAVAVAAIVVTIHVCLALARGGSLSCFLRPIKNAFWLRARWREGSYWSRAETAVREFVAALRLRHHFSLGVRGFLGAMAWLFIPTALFAAANKTEGGPILVTLLGAILLLVVLSWVPFLQANFAAENRLRAMFELRKVRQLYRNAPFSWLITMLVTLTFALPMYLFKIALPPADAMWTITIVFIVSIYPAKVLTGWAYHRAVARERRASLWLRLLSRLALAPLLVAFVFLLFFTQFIGEHGKGVLFEHHAFLLPSPF